MAKIKNEDKTILNAIIIVSIILLISSIPLILTRVSSKDDDSNSKVKAEAKTEEVIVLKPGEAIPLEINDKEWSPWIDASRKGLYSYAHAPKGITFMFRNGEKVTIGDGEKDKIFPNGSQYLVYKLKSPEGSQLAIIEASNEPIIE